MAVFAGFFFEIRLDDAVFKRMKTHHNQAPAGNNQPGCSVQSSFQFAQFVVDRNPQSLKSAGCRINADGRFVNDRINEFGQFTGCFYRLKLARGGNFGRNLPGFAFFAVFVDQICQFFSGIRLTMSAAVAPLHDIRISSGASFEKEKPRSA